MQTINLTNVNKSGIKYHVDKFPDGELSIVIDDVLNHKVDYVRIVTRLASMDDIFVLLQVTDILNRHEITFDLYISYLMSMRMDRVMDWNRPYSLKIVANMIKNCGSRNIYVMEAHSDKTLTFLNAKPWETDFDMTRRSELGKRYDGRSELVVYPDAGAKSRYSTNIIAACFTKKRDLTTGQIIGLCPECREDEEMIKGANDILIIDDLCDGGGTFAGIAKVVKELNPDAKLNIMVTHMVNPRGIENLSKNFDKVTFTNSYKNWENLPDNVHLVEVV